MMRNASAEDLFGQLPSHLFGQLLSYVPNAHELSSVNKLFYRGIQSSIYGADLITTMLGHLTAAELEKAIELYQSHPKFKKMKAVPIDALNPWLLLSLSIAKHIPDYEAKLPNAVFSVMKSLSPVQLKHFIRNYRRTPSCKALLNRIGQLENPGSIDIICQALLCDSIRRLDSKKLKTAIDDISQRFATDLHIMSILSGLKVTLRVRDGSKILPQNPDFYVNLRGAYLAFSNYTNVNFNLMDLQSANLYKSTFGVDNGASLVDKIYWGSIAYSLGNYLLNDPLGIQKTIMSQSIYTKLGIALGVMSAMMALKFFIKQSTGGAVLDDVDLSGADLTGTFFGESSCKNANFEGVKFLLGSDISDANFDNANLTGAITLETIDQILDKLISFCNLKSINEKIAKDIITAAAYMQKDIAIQLLQKACDHGFFTAENRKLTFGQKFKNFDALSSSAHFFKSFDLKGKPMLLEARANIENDPDYELKIKTVNVTLRGRAGLKL